MTGRMRWFLGGVAGWTAFGALLAVWVDVEHFSDGRHPLGFSEIGALLILVSILGAFTPALVFVARKIPLTRRPVALTILIYIVAVIAVCAVAESVHVFVSNTLLGKHYTVMDVIQDGFEAILTYAVALMIIVALIQVQIANERSARAVRLEADLTKLRVEALQRQLHPHFVFNTLNAVGAVMQIDVGAAEEMIAALAALLRAATDRSDRQVVPLREELQLLDRYVHIMKMRYGDRFTIGVSTEPKTLEILVPTFTLQPVVENAIVHGLDKSGGAIRVDVVCRLKGDMLQIDVTDDGTCLDSPRLREGVGLGNTRARLCELYGQAAVLSIVPRDSLGTQLVLAIPVAGPDL